MIRRKLLAASAIVACVIVCACSDLTAPKKLVPGSLAAAATIAPQLGESRVERTFDFTTIDVPGAISTLATDINPRGDIVGTYIDGDHHSHGYLLRNGQFTTIDFPGSAFTEAWGIDPEGEVGRASCRERV